MINNFITAKKMDNIISSVEHNNNQNTIIYYAMPRERFYQKIIRWITFGLVKLRDESAIDLLRDIKNNHNEDIDPINIKELNGIPIKVED